MSVLSPGFQTLSQLTRSVFVMSKLVRNLKFIKVSENQAQALKKQALQSLEHALVNMLEHDLVVTVRVCSSCYVRA